MAPSRALLALACVLAYALAFVGACARWGSAPASHTADQCRACRGDWAVHGLAPEPSCDCRTADAGKRCTDGADCEGSCVAASEDPERQVVEPGPQPRGFFVGKCSEFVTVWGCHRIIQRGARARGPQPLADSPTMLCVD